MDSLLFFSSVKYFYSKYESINFLDDLNILNQELFEDLFDSFQFDKCNYGNFLKKLSHYSNQNIFLNHNQNAKIQSKRYMMFQLNMACQEDILNIKGLSFFVKCLLKYFQRAIYQTNLDHLNCYKIVLVNNDLFMN